MKRHSKVAAQSVVSLLLLEGQVKGELLSVEELSRRAKVVVGKGVHIDIAFLPSSGGDRSYSPEIEAWLGILQSVRCGEFDMQGRFRLVEGGAKICRDTVHEASLLFPKDFPKIINALHIDMKSIVDSAAV